MREIELTQGKRAIVDDEDYEWLSHFKWHVSNNYAVRHNSELYKATGKRRLLPMHRVLLNPPANMYVDHINGDKLDNRKSNLRVCTKRQNNINVNRKDNRKYRGVQKCCNRYRSKIRVNGKQVVVGSFETEIEAALAYNEAAIKYHGEFAILNKVEREKLI
jgi:hypothetical protein